MRSAVAAAADGNGASTSAQSAAGATEGGTGATGEAFGDDLGAALGLSSRLVGTLSLLATALGPPLCSLGVHVLYGAVWRNTDLPAVLAWYCWYLNVLAINGIAEVSGTLSARRTLSCMARTLGCMAHHPKRSVVRR